MNGIDKLVRVRITREKKAVIYRMFFPKAVLPHAGLKAGSSLGFSLFVHDLTPEGMIRGISLKPTGPFRRPDLWNDLLLLPPPAK